MLKLRKRPPFVESPRTCSVHCVEERYVITAFFSMSAVNGDTHKLCHPLLQVNGLHHPVLDRPVLQSRRPSQKFVRGKSDATTRTQEVMSGEWGPHSSSAAGDTGVASDITKVRVPGLFLSFLWLAANQRFAGLFMGRFHRIQCFHAHS